MNGPNLDFLCDCLAAAFLQHYGVTEAPVPLREMLLAPPPDLARDLSLTEVSFGEAVWLRPPSGQGSIFVNSEMSESESRYAMARSLFIGLCATKGGREVGLPSIPNDNLKAQSDMFARRLLMAPELLPSTWRKLPPEALAEICGVPRPVAEAHLQAAERG